MFLFSWFVKFTQTLWLHVYSERASKDSVPKMDRRGSGEGFVLVMEPSHRKVEQDGKHTNAKGILLGFLASLFDPGVHNHLDRPPEGYSDGVVRDRRNYLWPVIITLDAATSFLTRSETRRRGYGPAAEGLHGRYKYPDTRWEGRSMHAYASGSAAPLVHDELQTQNFECALYLPFYTVFVFWIFIFVSYIFKELLILVTCI